MNSSPLIVGRAVYKTYDTGRVKVEALRGVDIAVAKGEIVAVMGPSGCGKILPIAWLVAATFGIGGLTLFSTAGPIVVVFVIYKWIVPWDVARMGRLPTVRRALAPHGLLVCERCGYDLFGHTDANRCPECGSDSPTP